MRHVISLNGSSGMELPNDNFVEEIIRRAPTLIDSKDQFAISLSRLPEGGRLRGDLSASWACLFLQAAGSAEAMMLEVRKGNLDGSDSLCKLARPERSAGTAHIA